MSHNSELAARLEKMAEGYEVLKSKHAADLRAAAQAVRLLGECSEMLISLFSDMPPKLDERLKYREVQFRDGEVKEIGDLIASIADWKSTLPAPPEVGG